MSELVKMPSGKKYRLEQPSLAWRLFNTPLPESLANPWQRQTTLPNPPLNAWLSLPAMCGSCFR